MQNMEKYFGFRVSVLDELDPIRVEVLKEKAEKIVAQYDFNPEEYFVYFHQISLKNAKDALFGLDGGVAARLKKLELTFAVNLKQERTKRIKIFNFLLDSDPTTNAKWSGGVDSVTYYIEGSYLGQNLGFRSELITFIDKRVRESHRKLKISLVAYPTEKFSNRIFKKTDQHLTQLDYKFRRPVFLRPPRSGTAAARPCSNQTNGGITVMGDQFNFNAPTQVAAAGSKATATQTTNQQVNTNSLDLNELKSQLVQLRQAMSERATTPADHAEIAVITAAEMAAEKGDKEGVLRQLKKAGNWTLEVGKEVGIGVVAEIIKGLVL